MTEFVGSSSSRDVEAYIEQERGLHCVSEFQFNDESSSVGFYSMMEVREDMQTEDGAFLSVVHGVDHPHESRKPADILWKFYCGLFAELDAEVAFLRYSRQPLLFRPEDLEDGPQGIAPITYLSDDMAAYVGIEKIETAPFYDRERVNGGYCLRMAETLPAVSNEQTEPVEDHLDLEYYG